MCGDRKQLRSGRTSQPTAPETRNQHDKGNEEGAIDRQEPTFRVEPAPVILNGDLGDERQQAGEPRNPLGWIAPPKRKGADQQPCQAADLTG